MYKSVIVVLQDYTRPSSRLKVKYNYDSIVGSCCVSAAVYMFEGYPLLVVLWSISTTVEI